MKSFILLGCLRVKKNKTKTDDGVMQHGIVGVVVVRLKQPELHIKTYLR